MVIYVCNCVIGMQAHGNCSFRLGMQLHTHLMNIIAWLNCIKISLFNSSNLHPMDLYRTVLLYQPYPFVPLGCL